MPTTTDAAECRELRLRKRPDLAISEQWLRGQRIHVVKDAISLKYFHLSEDEAFLFGKLDGGTSLAALCEAYELRFAPRRITPAQVHAYLGQLHREGLLIGTVPGQADALLERDHETAVRERWSWLLGLLAVRFRGVNPTWLLDRMYPWCRWLFSPVALVGCLVLIVGAMLLVATEWRIVSQRLPELAAFFSGGNIVWLAVVLAGVKCIHELGHALTLRHFGGECPTIGPMLLLCLPCLYCNTTDVWMLPSKWQRAAVAAAGIGVELVLAAVATCLWWFSEPGIFNSLCLNVMVVCSVSTLLFNGNPLLRYDGYYVLSDLLEVPNLSAQASAAARDAGARWLAGVMPSSARPTEPTLPAIWLVGFYIASAVYRVFVVLLILWTVHAVLKPRGLDALTGVVAILAFGGMLAMPLMEAMRGLRDPRWSDRMKFRRAGIRLLLFAFLMGAGLLIPLPMRVTAPAVIRPANAERVYATVEGTVVDALQIGDRVTRGQTLLQLQNPTLVLELERACGDRNRQALHLKNLRQQAIHSSDAAAELPAAEAALADLEQRLHEREAEAQRLTILSPRDGTILPPPNETPSGTESPEPDNRFLDKANRGQRVPRGSILCLIGDTRQHEALVLIEQSDVELVKVGQQAWLATATYPGQYLQGTVEEVSPARVEELPEELRRTGAIPGWTDKTDGKSAPSAWFEARIRLVEDAQPLTAGATATARIVVRPQSTLARVARFLSKTFRVNW